jgi:hypothetical protein
MLSGKITGAWPSLQCRRPSRAAKTLTLAMLRGYNNLLQHPQQTEQSMTSPEPLPPDMEALSAFVDSQPPEIREIFQYALAMLLLEEGLWASQPRMPTAGGGSQAFRTAVPAARSREPAACTCRF